MDAMHAIEPVKLARNYVTLSNSHDLALIKPLFAADATYHSAYFGEYKGSDAIHAMMARFFTRFPDAHWEVAEYRSIEDSGAEFHFVMTGVDASSGNPVVRHGLERIHFTPNGLIRHIAVCKPGE
jgi:hypothetical protein